MNQTEARKDFLTLPINLLIKKNAIPAVFSMLFMAFYQIVDGIMVGRRLGAEALASINIVYPIFALMAGIGIMIGVGGNAKIAVLLGKNKQDEASGILGLIVFLGVTFGLSVTLLTTIFMPHIVNFFGNFGSEISTMATSYLWGLTPFFTLMLLTFILEQSIRNDGKPNLASGVLAGCALLNIALDYLFLYVFNFNIKGAALATGISQSMGALIFIFYFISKKKAHKPGLNISVPIFKLKHLIEIFFNGSSELLNSLAAGISTFLFNRLILSYVGEMGIAAFALIQYFIVIGMFITMGIGNGCQPIISYNYGAGQIDRVFAVYKKILMIGSVVNLLLIAMMSLYTAPILNIFIQNQNDVVSLGIEIARYAKWALLFMSVGILSSIYYTAIEDVKRSVFIAFSRSLILPMLFLLTLPLKFNAIGIWITPLLSEGITALFSMVMIVPSFMYHIKNQNPNSPVLYER